MSEAATNLEMDESPEIEVPEAQIDGEYIEVPDDLKISPPGRNRFGEQAERNQKWRMDVPHNTQPEQCYEQEFWQHVAGFLRPGDEIVVMSDDMSWKLCLHVINAGHNWAQVAKESFVQYQTRDQMAPIEPIYSVKFAGTTKKWQVLRKGKLLKEGMETEALARRAAAMHEQAVKR
jgi:hypothetical protein